MSFTLMLETQVTKQSPVNGTWRNKDMGSEDAVLSWGLLMDSCLMALSELDRDLVQADRVKVGL